MSSAIASSIAAEPAVQNAIISIKKKMFAYEDSKWEMVVEHMTIVDEDERDQRLESLFEQ